jgi:hypothetical protein
LVRSEEAVFVRDHISSSQYKDAQLSCVFEKKKDVSDRYNNLKVAWDSLVEAANHGHPRAFQVAVTVVLEQLKREQPKKQRKD